MPEHLMSQSLSSIRYVSTNKGNKIPTVEQIVFEDNFCEHIKVWYMYLEQNYKHMSVLFKSVCDNLLIAFHSLFSGCSRNEKNSSEEETGNNTEKKHGAKATRESEVSLHLLL